MPLHFGMFRQRLAALRAESRHHIEDALGQPRFAHDPGQLHRNERSLLGWFRHDRIARRQRKDDHLRQQDQRRIERGNRQHHPQRFADDQRQAVRLFVGQRVRNSRRTSPAAARNTDAV
jgi:hypothetical protein